jgi:hypothetical protein
MVWLTVFLLFLFCVFHSGMFWPKYVVYWLQFYSMQQNVVVVTSSGGFPPPMCVVIYLFMYSLGMNNFSIFMKL